MRVLSVWLIALGMLFGLGCGACDDGASVPGDTLEAARPGLDGPEFQRGRELFQKPYGFAVGDIHAQSCASCHHHPGLGGEGAATEAEEVHPEGRPPFRVAPSLFGLGYLNDLDDADVLNGCGVDANRGIHGHPSFGGIFGTRPNRFFGKATSTDLRAAVTSELYHRLGQTSFGSPDEETHVKGEPVTVQTDHVQDIWAYVNGLELPPMLPEDTAGRALFENVGCAVCHRLDRSGTDLCLHDLGSALADQQMTTYATTREWKTARLVGVRFKKHLLHDGRAGVSKFFTLRGRVSAAVLAHGGEAAQVIEVFKDLPQEEQQQLLHFVEGL